LNRLLGLLPAVLVVAVAFGGPSRALEPNRVGELRRALAAADGGDWSGAARLATQTREPLAEDLIVWRRLLDARGVSFAEYRRFLAAHPDWPRQRELRRRAEEMIGDREDPKAVRAFFADEAPVTAAGRIRFAEALIAGGDRARAEPLLRAAWREGRFAANDEKTFLIRHATALEREDHSARLDYLLWSRAHAEARRMRGRVPPDAWLLAEARLALQTKAPGVDGAIARVPASLRTEPGLVYDRVRWRRDRELWDGAAELLLAHPQVEGWRRAIGSGPTRWRPATSRPRAPTSPKPSSWRAGSRCASSTGRKTPAVISSDCGRASADRSACRAPPIGPDARSRHGAIRPPRANGTSAPPNTTSPSTGSSRSPSSGAACRSRSRYQHRAPRRGASSRPSRPCASRAC
jgi:hypothetical protein